MAEPEKNYWELVRLGVASQLKTDLNRGVAALLQAKESFFQPHICLNQLRGVEVISRIAQNPERANTQFSISTCSIYDGHDDLWLNVRFVVSLDMLSSESMVILSPRQTAYIVANLPSESKRIVLEKVKTWYFEYLLKNLQQAVEKVSKQFDKGDMLLASDHDNRIFDIHGGRGVDVPYAEWDIVGSELFGGIFFGRTLFDHHPGWDGYSEVDNILVALDEEKRSTAHGLLTLARMFGVGQRQDWP